jgi:GDP-L-fucose synthase
MYFNLLHSRPAGCVMYSLCSGSAYAREHWREQMSEDYLGQHLPSDGQGFSKFVMACHSRQLDDVVTLRLFGIFGEHEDYRYKFISNTIAKRLCGLDVALVRNALYHYLDVADFCDIVTQMIDLDIRSGEYNVTPDVALELTRIIDVIDTHLGIDTGHRVLAPGLGTPYTGSNARLRRALGDLRFTPFADSVKRLVAHHRRHRSALDRDALERDALMQHARVINR